MIFSLTNENEIDIKYSAVCDADSIINLTNHTYFNLNGAESGTNVLDTTLQIDGERYIVIDEKCIPTGEIAEVLGTPFDFRAAKFIGEDICSAHSQIQIGSGFDHCIVFDEKAGFMRRAVASSDRTNIKMSCFTSEPSLQLYTGNHLDTSEGKGGVKYSKNDGFCLETQRYPDSPNHANFTNCVMRKNEIYTSETMYKFEKLH